MVLLDFSIILPSIPVSPSARRRTDQGGIEPHRHAIATWHISLKIAQNRPRRPSQLGGSASKLSMFSATAPQTPYSHFVRNEQLRHAWQLAFVITKPWGKQGSYFQQLWTPSLLCSSQSLGWVLDCHALNLTSNKERHHLGLCVTRLSHRQTSWSTSSRSSTSNQNSLPEVRILGHRSRVGKSAAGTRP